MPGGSQDHLVIGEGSAGELPAAEWDDAVATQNREQGLSPLVREQHVSLVDVPNSDLDETIAYACDDGDLQGLFSEDQLKQLDTMGAAMQEGPLQPMESVISADCSGHPKANDVKKDTTRSGRATRKPARFDEFVMY